MIGERGVRLSWGETTSSSARAFIMAVTLVLDEATSSLDHETEKEIIEETDILKVKNNDYHSASINKLFKL